MTVESGIESSMAASITTEGAATRLRALLLREFSVRESAAIIAGSFFISALLGAVRQLLLNARFGAGDTISAYYAAVRLPETLFTLIAGGALWTAMIPVLVDVRRGAGDAEERRLADIVLTAVLIVAGGLALIGIVVARPFVEHLLAPGFDEPTTDLTVRLTRLLLIHPVIIAAASVAMAVLNARSRFLLPAVGLAFHNVTEITGIGLAWMVPSVGIYGPVAGVIGGGVLQATLLFALLRPETWRPRPRWAPGDVGLRLVVRLLIPTSLSLGVGFLGNVTDAGFASRAREPEALAALVNGWLLVAFPVRLIGFAAGQAAFPQLVAAAGAPTRDSFIALTRRVAGIATLLTVPIAAGLAVIAEPGARLLFERGAFDAAAGALTGRMIALYAIGMPAYALTEVLTRSLYALRDTRTPLATNLLQLGLRVAICAIWLDDLGVAVIPIAFAASSFVEAAVLGGMLWRRTQGGATTTAAVLDAR